MNDFRNLGRRILALEEKSALAAPMRHGHTGRDAPRVRLDDIDRLGYGSMQLNGIQAVSVAQSNTYYEIASGWTEGELHHVAFGGSHWLKPAWNGDYLVSHSMTLTSTGDYWLFSTVMLDGTAQTGQMAAGTKTGGSGEYRHLSASAAVRISSGQQLSLAVFNNDAAANVTVVYPKLSIVRLR